MFSFFRDNDKKAVSANTEVESARSLLEAFGWLGVTLMKFDPDSDEPVEMPEDKAVVAAALAACISVIRAMPDEVMKKAVGDDMARQIRQHIREIDTSRTKPKS